MQKWIFNFKNCDDDELVKKKKHLTVLGVSIFVKSATISERC